MGFKNMNAEKLYQVYRRWFNREKISKISISEHLDRKTIRKYLSLFTEQGLLQNILISKEAVIPVINKILFDSNKRKIGHVNPLKKYKEEIVEMVCRKQDPLKSKSAYIVLKGKYDLTISYSSFKRFVKREKINKGTTINSTIRIEMPPGHETQIDYGKVGRLFDSISKKNRDVYAFCASLSYSRGKYIEFTFKQDEVSFAESNVKMWEHFGGTTNVINLDNLKAGVIKPDLYEPELNKSFRELTEYYGIFADPSRVASPKDKGKVERFVPQAREQFRILKELHPEENIHLLNKRITKWCIDEYGQTKHGTTNIAPNILFEDEKKHLKPLPKERFSVPRWKQAKVHPDQFIQFEKKCYSVPYQYVGQHLWVRKCRNLVDIYKDSMIIKTYSVPNGFRNYDPNHFPEIKREMMNNGLPKHYLNKAKEINDQAYNLIKQILSPHAQINCRKAGAMLDFILKNRHNSFLSDVLNECISKKIGRVESVKKILKQKEVQFDFNKNKQSEIGKAMTRDSKYFYE